MQKPADTNATPSPTSATPPRNWRRDLKLKPGSNVYLPTAANAKLIFANDKVWAGKLAWDEMNYRPFFLSSVKLGPDNMPDPAMTHDHFWDDSWTFLAATWLERSPYAISLPLGTVREAITSTAQQKCVHPIREWLRGLKWDNIPRLDTWFATHCGVTNTPYHRAAFSKWLISAVARVMRPGCQADHMLVLEGPKGVGKTSFFRILGGEWYVSMTSDLGGKDAIQNLWGALIAELPELSAVKRAQDVERVKAFITTSVDKIRRSYGHDSANYPRQCVLGGSTNAAEWLREDSERRFWPYHTNTIDLAALKADREQLWAEAHARYLAGEKWYITDPEALAELAEEVEARREVDPWEATVGKWLESTPRTQITTAEVLTHLGFSSSERSRAEEIRIGTVLRVLGWERKRLRIKGIPRWVYTKCSYVPIVPITSDKLLYAPVLPLRNTDRNVGTLGTEGGGEMADIGKHGEIDGK